jgi:phenylacetic acid degradation operon negative regulatory protein
MMTRCNDLFRPLTARSVIASVLLGTHPPVLPVKMIVRTTELFGISPGATRVALSRMVSAGELVADDGHYRLAGHLVDRQERQEQSRRPRLAPWTGGWLLAIVPGGGRPPAERSELRAQLRRARMAELREGVWCRPDNLALSLPGTVDVWSGRPAGAVPTALWDLGGWAATAGELLDAMAEGVDDLGRSFVVAAAVLRHLQGDPLLPDELLPPAWPGASLRCRYEEYEEAFQARLRDWFGAHR